MYLKKNYPWRIDLTDFELTVLRKVLRGETLTDAEDTVADKLSSVMDKVYHDKTEGNGKKQWSNKE